tara:strand:- start:1761 stop:2036 length:276 start_codon:yes stop_codon:yes gene_type:complete
MSDLHKAILKTHSNVRTVDGDTNPKCYDANGNLVTDIDMDKVNAWVDPDAYKISRVSEYPAITDQLDDLYHNGIDGWKATIKAIKDKYPKG